MRQYEMKYFNGKLCNEFISILKLYLIFMFSFFHYLKFDDYSEFACVLREIRLVFNCRDRFAVWRRTNHSRKTVLTIM